MKKAFTMLELVFVIVIIGILSVVAMPSFNRDTLQEAANQVVLHIRYTQHLAMMDDKFDSNATWFKNRWQIFFQDGNAYNDHSISYTIFSNLNQNTNANSFEIAKNPLNTKKVLSGGTVGASYGTANVTTKMNLGHAFGITNVTFQGGCSHAKRISFDNLGRPIQGNPLSQTNSYLANNNNRLLRQQCRIVLSSDENITIAIEPETGYTHIL